MAPAVYLLCALAALGCMVLLLRAFRATGARLLLWGGVCFLGLMINNALVFADLVLFRDLDLFVWRNLAALAGIGAFVFGLIWETQR